MAKAKYGAVPMNAIGDPRMTLHRFKVLAAVASYDRFTKNGMGCTAGLKGLAKATGLYGSDVSVAVNDLVEMGYLIRERSPLDRRRMTLRVVYEGGEIVSASSNQPADEVVSASPNNSSEIVRPGDEKEVPDQGVTDCNILSEALARISQVSSIFSAARRRFCYKNHEVVAYMERRIWHTRWVNRNRGAFGSFLTVD